MQYYDIMVLHKIQHKILEAPLESQVGHILRDLMAEAGLKYLHELNTQQLGTLMRNIRL